MRGQLCREPWNASNQPSSTYCTAIVTAVLQMQERLTLARADYSEAPPTTGLPKALLSLRLWLRKPWLLVLSLMSEVLPSKQELTS